MKIFVLCKWIAFSAALSLLLGNAANAQSGADDPDVPVATGEHWIKAERNGKLAYLLGIANTLDIEQALHGDSPPSDDASLVPVMMRGLSGMSLNQIADALDRWYADNPDRVTRPVLETIWFEIAKPNS